MKLLLLLLLVCIYSFTFGQAPGWQEIGKTACGPVLIKLGELPDSTVSGAYNLKLDGSPEAGCEVVVRAYFMTVSGNKVYNEVTLSSSLQWQGNGKVEADSLLGFMRAEIMSATGCSCTKAAPDATEAPDSTRLIPTPAARANAPDTATAAVLAHVPDKPATTPATDLPLALPDTAAAPLPLATDKSLLPENPATGKELTSTNSAATPEAASATSASAGPPDGRTIAANLDISFPATLQPDTALANEWAAASTNAALSADSSAADEEYIELHVLSAAELDSIRIYNDPFIQEGLNTIANAYALIDQDRVARYTVPNAGMELELLEEKQQLFMDKYAMLVKTGNYGLHPCSACHGNPIIHQPDSYPPFVSCEVCKGGGYELSYHGKAKPNTIAYLYFAELLPSPDYRKPTSKRIAENPADFDYENGIFKTKATTLSPSHNPFFFVCFYFKAKGDKHNRMLITEVLDKRKNETFVGAGKAEVRRLLELYFPDANSSPDDIYIWEFNTAEDAYDRSIIPLHRASVVGFDVDIINYLPDPGSEMDQTTVLERH